MTADYLGLGMAGDGGIGITYIPQGNRKVSLAIYCVDVKFRQIFGPKRGPRYQNDRQISPVTDVRSDKAERALVRSDRLNRLR